MSAIINKWDNWKKDFEAISDEGSGSVSSFIEPANKTMVLIYVEVISGAASLELSVEEESIPNKTFSVSSFNGENVDKTVMNFVKPGTYRIPVPMAENEEKLHIYLSGPDCQLWSVLESEKN